MNIGRPRKFSPDQALDAAMHQFWRRGYEPSSLQELISTMGLSKSSFYQTFKSKRDLFHECIKYYTRVESKALTAQLNSSPSAKSFINSLLLGVAEETSSPDSRRGCLLVNTATEFSQSDPKIAKLVEGNIGRFKAVFESAVRQAQHDGEVRADKTPQALATYLFSTMSGLRNLVKAGEDAETITATARIALSALD